MVTNVMTLQIRNLHISNTAANTLPSVNIGSRTEYNNRLPINAVVGRDAFIEKNGYRCTFRINVDTASYVLVIILTEHRKANRISSTYYNNFMSSYMIATNGRHSCVDNPSTGMPYLNCPKYFSKEFIDVINIYDEWRSQNKGVWDLTVDNFCRQSNQTNQTYCKCVGVKFPSSIFYNDFRRNSDLASATQCFWLPCQNRRTYFTNTIHDDISMCSGLTCANIIHSDTTTNLDSQYNQNITCNQSSNTLNDSTKAYNESNVTNIFSEFDINDTSIVIVLIIIGIVWFLTKKK